MRDRAYRRHHRARMEDHARKVLKSSFGIDDPEQVEEMVGHVADNLQVCSCPACGSQRRNEWAPRLERITMAERRSEESFKDQMEAANV